MYGIAVPVKIPVGTVFMEQSSVGIRKYTFKSDNRVDCSDVTLHGCSDEKDLKYTINFWPEDKGYAINISDDEDEGGFAGHGLQIMKNGPNGKETLVPRYLGWIWIPPPPPLRRLPECMVCHENESTRTISGPPRFGSNEPICYSCYRQL